MVVDAEQKRGALQPYVYFARAYVAFSCLLGVICCIWTVHHYGKSDPEYAFGWVGTVFSCLLFFAAFHQILDHQRTNATESGKSCPACYSAKDYGARLAHVTASFITIFSVCVATANIINWYSAYDVKTKVSNVLLWFSVITIIIQWLFCTLCVPCNGIKLCFVSNIPDSHINLLHQQYVVFTPYLLAPKTEK